MRVMPHVAGAMTPRTSPRRPLDHRAGAGNETALRAVDMDATGTGAGFRRTSEEEGPTAVIDAFSALVDERRHEDACAERAEPCGRVRGARILDDGLAELHAEVEPREKQKPHAGVLP